MKFNELQIGVEYGVIPSWQYSSRDKKDPTRVRRSDVAKVTLVNLTKYEYKVYRSQSAIDPSFTKAPQGSRSVGYLVLDGSSGTHWLARPQDIVERWSILESRWVESERLEREEQARRALEQKKAEEQRKLAQERRLQLEKATFDSLKSILGNRITVDNLYFDTRYSRTNDGVSREVNTVRFDLELAQILIERVLEAKEVMG